MKEEFGERTPPDKLFLVDFMVYKAHQFINGMIPQKGV
jgi:hypothetical protein